MIKKTKAQVKEMLDAMMAYCEKHNQPIPRNRLCSVFGLDKTDIKKLEKAGLIQGQYQYFKNDNRLALMMTLSKRIYSKQTKERPGRGIKTAGSQTYQRRSGIKTRKME